MMQATEGTKSPLFSLLEIIEQDCEEVLQNKLAQWDVATTVWHNNRILLLRQDVLRDLEEAYDVYSPDGLVK